MTGDSCDGTTCNMYPPSGPKPDCPNNNPITIPGVVTLQDFKKYNSYKVFAGCGDPNCYSVCGTCGGNDCSGSHLWYNGKWYPEGGCCNPYCISIDTTRTDEKGCTINTWNIRQKTKCAYYWPPTGSGYYCWVCEATDTKKDYGGAVYNEIISCDYTADIIFPNGTVLNDWNFREKPYEDENVKIVAEQTCSYGSTCMNVLYSITPKTFALEIYYEQLPNLIIVGQNVSIKAHIKSNITQPLYNSVLNGYWTYSTPFGYKTESFSKTIDVLYPNQDYVIEVPIPTSQVVSMAFKFDTIKVYYDIETAWHALGETNPKSYTFTLDLPENQIIVNPKPMICYSDSDCKPPCPGVVGYCENNNCHFEGTCIREPGGTFRWEWLSNIWYNFITWLKGLLGWA